MKDGARIGMAVGLGYLLGRSRKGRLALMLIGVGATGRLGKNPAALLKQGADVLGSSPEVKTLTENVRGRLVEAGKAAAVSAVSNRVDTLTGKIEERTGALTSSPLGGPEQEPEQEAEHDEHDEHDEPPQDQQEDQQQDQGEDEAGEEEQSARPRSRRTATRRPRRAESADEPEDDERADDGPRRPAKPSSRRPPVRRTRRRVQ